MLVSLNFAQLQYQYQGIVVSSFSAFLNRGEYTSPLCQRKLQFILPLVVFILLSLTSCTAKGTNPLFVNQPKTATGIHVALSTAHPLASEASAAVLKKGGNAIDAAVTASLVLGVVRPQSTGIGGGGFMLFFDKKSGKTHAFDFRERAPQKITTTLLKNSSFKPNKDCQLKVPSADGHLAVATPGTVVGLWKIHRRFGKLPFADVVRPAVLIANRGFPVYPSLAEAIKVRKNVLICFKASRKLFLPNGIPLSTGDVLRQPDLARTLATIAAQGSKGFTQGWVATAIVDEMKSGHGVLSLADLSQYRMIERSPLTMAVKNHTIISMPPPSSGGVLLFEMIEMVTQLAKKHPELYSSQWNRDGQLEHYITEIMKRAFADRAKFLGDPKTMKVSPSQLTNRRILKKWVRLINSNSISTIPQTEYPRYESPSTTHFSIVDESGNAVSSTQTVNTYFGSGIVVPETGIILNNEIDDFWTGKPNAFGLVGTSPNNLEPTKTPLSSMTPTLVMKNGELKAVLGSPGGPRIISATFLLLFHYLFRSISLKESVQLPRVHHQWSPDILFLESNISAVRKNLAHKGHTLGASSMYFGDIHGIEKKTDGTLTAVSDHRSDGQPIAW
jgi:gamma-glutamyltranspeptidase / glutathione hydrolase